MSQEYEQQPDAWDFALEYLHYCTGVAGDSSILSFERWMGESLIAARRSMTLIEKQGARPEQALRLIDRLVQEHETKTTAASADAVLKNIRDVISLAAPES